MSVSFANQQLMSNQPGRPITMKTITKYQTTDGCEFTDQDKAATHEELCLKVQAAMLPLGDVPRAVQDGKGWLQHDLETVLQAKDDILEICRAQDDILEICRAQGYAEHYPVFNNPGRECHPLSIIGRILNAFSGPLDTAWSRFARIDAQGREHQQRYYAYTNGPHPEHVCVEDRRKPSTANV